MIENLLQLARPEIINLVPYSSARREHAASGIYLNANENPYPKTSQEYIHRYPQPQPEKLRDLLAGIYEVNADQILMTRGSDEGIDLWLRAFCAAGKDSIVVFPPTYDMYEISAKIQHATVLRVPLVSPFNLDVDGLLSTWEPQHKLIFLCSPNNPTGNVYSQNEILRLCKALEDKAIIIVDEAYIEFSDKPSMSKYLNQYDNLVVLRTLSKAYGMAGARCGAVLAHPQLIQLLEKVISPYPLATPVVNVILDELQEEHLLEIGRQIEQLKNEREAMSIFLKKLKYVKEVWPSEANFILFRVNDSKSLVAYCAAQNVIIRDRCHMTNLENCVRISIGLPSENKQLQTLLERYE